MYSGAKYPKVPTTEGGFEFADVLWDWRSAIADPKSDSYEIEKQNGS